MLPVMSRNLACNVLLSISVLLPVPIRASDYAEITVELNSTWESGATTNRHSTTATCIVGDNNGFISGEFSRNAKVDYWLMDSNVIEHRTIINNMYIEQAKDAFTKRKSASPTVSYPNVGETFTTVHPSPIGQPVFRAVEGVVWLALCSGNYLKKTDRQIPMPMGPSSLAFGYSDKTVLFDDPLGLPKSVALFATNGTLVCEYQVLKATNYFGRTFPLEFHATQWGNPARGSARSGSKSDVLGTVTSIKPGTLPELPEEVRKKLKP